MADGEITWQAAVEILAKQRTRAEAAAGLLKKYADAASIDLLSVRYSRAKAVYDGILAGLIVALAKGEAPESLDDLNIGLSDGFDQLKEFSDDVSRFLPPTLHRKDAPIADIVEGVTKAVIGPIIDAFKTVWLRRRDDDALLRNMIETQLNATRWPDFAAVPKAP